MLKRGCGECGGRGRIECYACASCALCGGTQEMKCEACDGEGEVPVTDSQLEAEGQLNLLEEQHEQQ